LATKFKHCPANLVWVGRDPDLANELRSLTAGRYVIFYLPLSNGVDIVRVLLPRRGVTGMKAQRFSLCLCVSVVKIFSALSACSAVNAVSKVNGAANAAPSN
jgi:hypothetical protein